MALPQTKFMVDIFNETKEKSQPTWAKFVNAGDSYQGTYVGKIEGVKDSYGNEQIVYQLLQDDDSIINVGFGLNKKVLNQDMQTVKFGQIIGFRYKGTVEIKDRRTGKMINVKDFDMRQDPKIVNQKWLEENKNDMPKVTRAENTPTQSAGDLDKFVDDLNGKSDDNDVPFSSESSLTNEDKLKAIGKLADEKLANYEGSTKERVMEATGIAFIPLNYDKILEALAKIGF